MQWRAHLTSIGLTIAAAGALAYAYVDRGSVTESEKKTRDGDVFGAWRREDLTRITLDHGAEHVVLERTKDDAGEPEWWMRAPLAERGNGETCDRLASALELASVVRKVAPDVHPPGFDPPRATGEVSMGAVTYRFALGGTSPTPEGSGYLRLDGGGTVVVGRELVTELLQGADTYRSRQFVPYVSVQLDGLDIKSDKGELRLERRDDISFALAPSGLRASRAKLDAVWGALGDMRAEAFVNDSVAAPLVAEPRVSIAMTPIEKGAAVGLIRVGDTCPGNPDDVLVVREAPTRLSACAPKGILAGLATTPAELEDTRLFAAHDDEIAELRLETLPAGPAFELARKEEAWREKAPVERDLSGEEAEAASALVKAIAAAEGASPRKTDEPFVAKFRATIHRADKGAVEVVEVSAPSASGDAVVRRAFDGARLDVGAAVARKLMPRAVALRGRDPWTPPVEGLSVVSIDTRCKGIDQRVVHDGDAWRMFAPVGYKPDNASVVDLIDAVTRVKADAWAADADDGTFGLGTCSIALTVNADGGTRVARLDLGGVTGEGGKEERVYARTGDSPAVFVASSALLDRARASLIDLHGFAPSAVGGVGGVDGVILERDGKRLSYAADAGAGDATRPFLDAANVLRADAVEHLGPAHPDEGFAHPSLVLTLRAGAASRRVVFGRETPDGKSRLARVDGTDATFRVDHERTKEFFEPF